jgi:type I restriction enzyme, S subunit
MAKVLFLQQYGLKEGLGLDDVKESPVLEPPPEEQRAISAHIANIFQEFDHVADEMVGHIRTLMEYKSTLIAHAVTGKIKI